MLTIPSEMLARHGLRCTRQREAIYEALASTQSHPTAEELHEMVQVQLPGVSLATVYNTLEAFTRAGLCRKIPVTSGSIRYDAEVEPHLHVVNSETGAIHDVPEQLSRLLFSSLSEEVITQIERQLGMRIDGISVQLNGVPARRICGAGLSRDPGCNATTDADAADEGTGGQGHGDTVSVPASVPAAF